MKQSHGGQIPYSKGMYQNDTSITREKIAKETGVSAPTIIRDAQLAEAVEELTQEIPKEVLKQNPKKDIILGALQPHISVLSKA